jgi:hypothetical protein
MSKGQLAQAKESDQADKRIYGDFLHSFPPNSERGDL